MLGGSVTAEQADRRDVTWPGGCVRLVADAERMAGIARLECTGDGPDRTVTVAGTDLVITSH